MIITLTTAKYDYYSVKYSLSNYISCSHPDVFMESYSMTAAAPIFFMIYMFITFYYFSNVVSVALYMFINSHTFAKIDTLK